MIREAIRNSLCITAITSGTPRQQPLRAQEHQHDKEGEGKNIAPLEIEIETRYRDDLGEQERRDTTADNMAAAAENADQKNDRPEGQTDKRLHVMLQNQQTRGQPGQRAAD